jgi:hypothetical protein
MDDRLRFSDWVVFNSERGLRCESVHDHLYICGCQVVGLSPEMVTRS